MRIIQIFWSLIKEWIKEKTRQKTNVYFKLSEDWCGVVVLEKDYYRTYPLCKRNIYQSEQQLYFFYLYIGTLLQINV